jgi:tRNA(Ile)-lysidine synthase
MLEQVKHTLQQYDMVPYGSEVLAAVSGGRDSMALLHVLRSLCETVGFRLSAIHINHGLRTESEREQQLVQAFAETLGIPLCVVSLDIAENRQKGESVEMAARRLRYGAFLHALALLPKNAVLATAHHQRDQAETVLMHLIRGSGTRGLGGMSPVRLPFVRPMLFVPHADIERYVQENAIPYCEDESNSDRRYLRNRIRHDLLPRLKNEYNANIERALGTTAMAAREDEAFLRLLAEGQKEKTSWKRIDNLAVWMDCEAFLQLPVPLQKRMVRIALEEIGIYHMEEGTLQRSLEIAATGGAVQLAKNIFVKGGKWVQIYLEKALEVSVRRLPVPGCCDCGPFTVSASQDSTQTGQWLWSAALSPHALQNKLSVRTRRNGDRIAYEYGHKKLSDALSDAHMPACVRDHLPVLLHGDEVIWMPGLRVSPKFAASEEETGIITIYIGTNTHGGGNGYE